MVRFERNQDLAVGRANRGIVGEREIDKVWRATVIDHRCELVRRNDLADHVFGSRENLFAFFETCSRRRVEVKSELPGIHSREEVAPDNWQNHESTSDQDRKQNKDRPAIL